MNLKGRYDMLRTAALGVVGVPDDLNTLKGMASILRIPALTDNDAAASLLLLQTLIVTHDKSIQSHGAAVFKVMVTDGDWTGTLAEWQARGTGR